MDPAAQRLLDVIGEPFDGEDVVAAVGEPAALDGLRLVFDPLIADRFVTEMVADSSFRQERIGIEGFLEAWRDWAAPWDRLRIEVNEVLEVGGGGLFTEVEQIGIPKGGSSRDEATGGRRLADGGRQADPRRVPPGRGRRQALGGARRLMRVLSPVTKRKR